MSVKNFLNATTPRGFRRDGYANGGSNYKMIEEDDIRAEWIVEENELPENADFLNNLNRKGLLTLLDFHFLFLLVATPKRYVETIFHAFDISADGKVEAKVDDNQSTIFHIFSSNNFLGICVCVGKDSQC